ncbi:MAG: hypothetical protein M3137_07295 [Actinomycetota bacterium]|nr:hypothetical protein [Actinomycetota bacterium]
MAVNADRLIATIDAATAAEWESARLGTDAAEVVWLALHAATHHLDDAELDWVSPPGQLTLPAQRPGRRWPLSR